MLKKKNGKPLYYKKSKAAKRVEQEEFSESEESFTETQSEYQSPPRRRRGVQFNREYEYSGMEEQYDDKPYRYWSMYNMDNDVYSRGNEVYSTENTMYDDYTSQGSSYHRPRKPLGRNKPYATTESGFSNESDSDCVLCPKGERRGRQYPRQVNRDRVTESLETISEYSKGQQRHKQKQKYRNTKRNSRPDDTAETENPYPYRKDVNVYLARHPIGHRAFAHKRQEQAEVYTTQSDTESASEEESDKEVTRRVMKKQSQQQPQYQVYAAQVGQAPADAFKKQGRERLLSVTDYDGNVPMMALRDKMQKGVNRTESGIVYLPVIVLDNGDKMPKNKIMTTHSLLDRNDGQAEKPLETNVQVYAATDMEQGNIFKQPNKGSNTSIFEQSKKGNDGNIYEQTKKGSDGENFEPPLTQNITIFTVDQEQANPLKQSEENKTVRPQSDYPVQRSYINVAPSKLNPENTSNKKKPKSAAKSALSGASLRSFLARARPGRSKSPKPKKEKKGKKGKKEKKDKSKSPKSKENLESTSSEPITVVDLSNEDKQQNKEAQTPSLRPNSILQEISATVINESTKPTKSPSIEKETFFANTPTNNNAPQEFKKSITSDKKAERNSIVGCSNVIPANTGPNVGETRKSLVSERRKSTNWDKLRSAIGERPNIVIEEQPQNIVGERKKSILQERPRSVLGERHKITIEEQPQNISGERQKSINEEITRSILGERQKSIMEERPKGIVGERQKSVLAERQRSIIIGDRYENKDMEQGKHTKIEEGKNKKNINNILRKSEPTMQPSREEIQKLASEPIHKTESNVMQPEKKSRLSRMISKKKKASKENVPEIQPTSKQLLTPIPENLDNYPYTCNESPPTSPKAALYPLRSPHHTVITDPNLLDKKLSRSSQRTKQSPLHNRRPTGYRYQDDWANEQEKQPLRVWGYNLPFLVYVFQAAQFFLGLSLHDKFMEVLHTFLYNDDT